MDAVYLNDWATPEYKGTQGFDALIYDFCITPGELAGAEVLLASYTYENYSGTAFVLFRRDGKLYEVNGSHCSCYGLEGQWEPEETTVAALQMRVDNGDGYRLYEYQESLRGVLSSLKEECSCGKNKLTEHPHPCPFQEEIHGDGEPACRCCDECRHECAMDI